MDSILDCFGEIVGTTKDSTSDSGLYLTDLEAIETIEGLIENKSEYSTSADSILEKLESARRSAILQLNTDLTTLMMRYAKPRDSYNNIIIGGKKYTQALTETGLSGMRLLCRPIRDAEIILRGVNTLFNENGFITLKIASNIDDTITEYNNIETKARKVATNEFAAPLVLPLWHKNVSGCVEYYIYHENEVESLTTRIKCSTCSKFYFNADAPQWSKAGYQHYLNVAGFNVDAVENLTKSGVNYSKGIQLLLDIRCRTDRAVCSDSMDMISNPMAMSYATAIQYKAGANLIWNILRDPGINKILMADAEELRSAATWYNRRYNDMIKVISKNMPLISDCFCEHGFTRVNIGHP